MLNSLLIIVSSQASYGTTWHIGTTFFTFERLQVRILAHFLACLITLRNDEIKDKSDHLNIGGSRLLVYSKLLCSTIIILGLFQL